MLIDRLGTFGAANRIDHHLVSHVRHADDVAHQPLNRPEFLLRADSAGKSDHPRTDSYVDVGRVESRLLIEGVANQRAQLIVTQVFDSLDVLVILFHCSSGSALWAVQVTGRTAATRRLSEPDCSSRRSEPGCLIRPPSRRWAPRSTRSGISADRDSRSSPP